MDGGDGHVLEKFENAKTCADICLKVALGTEESVALATVEGYDLFYQAVTSILKLELFAGVSTTDMINYLMTGVEVLTRNIRIVKAKRKS